MVENKNNLEESLQKQAAKEKAWEKELKNKPVNIRNNYTIDKEEILGQGLSEQETAERLNNLKLKERVKIGLKSRVKQNKAGQTVEKVKKTQEDLKKIRNIYRIINGTSAVTVVGLIITWFVMNTQLILGNWLKSKKIPKLEGWEIALLIVVDLILLAVLFFILFIVYLWLNPCAGLELTGWGWLESMCEVILPGT